MVEIKLTFKEENLKKVIADFVSTAMCDHDKNEWYREEWAATGQRITDLQLREMSDDDLVKLLIKYDAESLTNN